MTREDSTKILAIIQTGELMSNVLYNIGTNMRAGDKLDARQVQLAAELRRSWDDSIFQAKESLNAMKRLPAAFDPIEMGA